MRKFLVYAGLAIWLAAVLAAFALLGRYAATPGPVADQPVPLTWPTESAIAPVPGKPNLVMFTHPQCPCTRASLAELARLASDAGPDLQIHIVLVRPADSEPGFEDGPNADRAAAITGAHVVVDDGEVEARRFGATTSGMTVLYTARGDLAFGGGLTTARGHEGTAPGYRAILDVVRGARRLPGGGAAHRAPTFGCALAADDDGSGEHTVSAVP